MEYLKDDNLYNSSCPLPLSSSPRAMAELNFVDFSRVPTRIWNSAEGARVRERLSQVKKALGNNLEKVDLYPNVGHVSFGTGEVLNGLNYHIKRGTPVTDILPFLGPLYQHFSVFNFGAIEDSKLEGCKKEWADIIDPPAARGSGIPGYGVNVQEQIDLVELCQKRGDAKEKQWFTSLGTYYPGYAIVSKDKLGQVKLVLAGGHEQLHKKLAMSITQGLKIEDIADRNFTLDMDNSLGLTIKTIKDLQAVNHSHIAAKVMSTLGLGKYQGTTGFSTPVPIPYSCFYNTIHESTRQRGTQAQTFTITQGVVDTSADLTEVGASDLVRLYMIESPKKIHELNIYREFLDKVRYFPITTGSSEVASFGMSEKDKIDVRNNVHWTGISSVHNIGNISYQPYDPTLKSYTNMLFGGDAYAVVASDQPLDGIIYSVTGFDPTGLSVDNYLDYTSHLPDDAVVKAPVTSAPIKLIFDTFPRVLDVLKAQRAPSQELFKVVQTNDQSAHYVQFPLGALRVANKVAQQEHKTNVPSSGLERINPQ